MHSDVPLGEYKIVGLVEAGEGHAGVADWSNCELCLLNQLLL